MVAESVLCWLHSRSQDAAGPGCGVPWCPLCAVLRDPPGADLQLLPSAHTQVFSLGNLSFLDFCYSFVYTPKVLVTCISEDKSISFTGCAAQYSSLRGWATVSVICWLPWLLTARCPFPVPCSLLRSCQGDCASVCLYFPILGVLPMQ